MCVCVCARVNKGDGIHYHSETKQQEQKELIKIYSRLRSPFAIRDANSKQSKTKIYEKNSPFVADRLAVIGRYGSHLMIVMIFVTQNTV